MAEKEVITSYPLKCKGKQNILNEAVDVSFTLYKNGEKEVGCVNLEDGRCAIGYATLTRNKADLPECPFLYPKYKW